MLSSDEIAELAGAICATAETLGQTISANAAQLMAEDLAEHEPAAIANALRACRRELSGRLTLAAILQRIQAADGRPGKDEAWAIALTASDEYQTVVLTEEIRVAMNASDPILQAGDKVGARMAFMSAYERLVTQARAEAKPARWDVSLGFDPAGRVLAIETAVRMQLLPPERATKYLADMSIAPVTQDGGAIAGLLSGEVRPASPAVREKLQAVREEIAKGKALAEEARRKKAQADLVDTYLRKRQLRAALAELNAKRGAA
ncbi:hypothetical protein [Pseudomonas typographi]|uniref:Prophage PssSM-02 n=1 Tax=Pseudomonas typographi TaxID=2715964 RepID=A0ABR7Z5Z6_9PSED|nr:hypothetical protein [Pseudomonas typographi]MBD1600885.1 hypothetical protein [Pseudomonas typographi]